MGYLARQLEIQSNIASVRDIDRPVLELDDKAKMEGQLLKQIMATVDEEVPKPLFWSALGCRVWEISSAKS